MLPEEALPRIIGNGAPHVQGKWPDRGGSASIPLMSEVQQLKRAAVAMTSAAWEGRAVAPVLRRLCPRVYEQLVRDSKYPGILAAWGRSLNRDEVVNQTIVHPSILATIGALAGVSMSGRSVHAGVQHTYGYLFSLIETPYGAKRDRWTSVNLERGFGLDLTLFSSRPRDGTLLANVTWFLTQITALRPLRTSSRAGQAVATQLLEYDYGSLPTTRVVEQAVLPGRARRVVRLITDLVPYPHPPADSHAESTLLVYSVQYGTRSRVKLITTFPVPTRAARSIEAEALERSEVEVRPRYNAYVPGFRGRVILGRRSLTRPGDQN